MITGDWRYCTLHGQPCRLVDKQTLWGEDICRVWLAEQDRIVRVPASSLQPIDILAPQSISSLEYAAAGARVADALSQDILLSPMVSSVTPLPHQIQVVSRAISSSRVRYLLADEVGLGKTIEAGLILKELKLRGLVERTLIIVPRGLVPQWVAEMRTRFDEDFRVLIPGEFSTYRNVLTEENIWQTVDQVITPMDSVKPVDRRRGWSREQLAEYNRDRYEGLVSAGWDLVIVDEAHRLGGSTEQVARHKLGRGLAEASPFLLLLSATPHQGKSDSFYRLVSLLDSQAIPDPSAITRERVRPYVIRTEKRRAIDAQGQPLFKPRYTRLVPVSWQDRHREQRVLYSATTEYVRQGYNQALLEKKTYVGLLLVLIQRLVTSSTRAIRTTLERRLDVLRAPGEQLSMLPSISDEDWAEMDGQEQVDSLLKVRLAALKNERSEVELLLEMARRTEAVGPDAKAEALLELIYRLQQEESDPDLKCLVFTEFVPTQEMLRDFLTERGFSVVCLNGSMDLEERQKAQADFAKRTRILVSTDAGGEGLNLQFCHVVVNYDIPWNPMRLEQRIGRVDRIGQAHAVRAHNFTLEDTIEFRVREVLEEKLAVILREYGVDKTEDVLNSSTANELFDKLYLQAILNSERIESGVDEVARHLQEQAQAVRDQGVLLGFEQPADPREAQGVREHPLPYWVERMTLAYLEANRGRSERRNGIWDLAWPDGTEMLSVVFTARDAEAHPEARRVTLSEPRIRALVDRIPGFVPGQPVPVVVSPRLPIELHGLWSLWVIRLRAPDWSKQRIMPCFLHDDGRVLSPAARAIWDDILAQRPNPSGHLSAGAAAEAFERAAATAEVSGKPVYEELVSARKAWLDQNQAKAQSAFQARRRVIARIGLASVREHRLAQLAQEESAWRRNQLQDAKIVPELSPLLLIRVEGLNIHA